jgi:hypothetical protein
MLCLNINKGSSVALVGSPRKYYIAVSLLSYPIYTRICDTLQNDGFFTYCSSESGTESTQARECN